jgi:molybdopterin converting factor small subunit
MRTFAFLLEGGVPLVRAQRIVAPLKLSKRGMDPRDGSEKGRLVWWHENFVAGIDSTGFCAFSAAGVLADGVMELEELAGALLERSPGRAAADELLGRGASLCLLAREVSGLEGAVRPRAEELADPWEEYRALRGLDAEGVVLAEVAASVGGAEVLRWDRAEESGSAVTRGGAAAGGRGVVSFTGIGEVGRALGGRVEVELEFPIRLGAALGVLTRGREELRELLFVKEEAIATGMRAGERVDLEDELADGDQVDLVMAVGGG